MTPEQLTAEIKTQAELLGFDACGVAVAQNADPEDRFGTWLKRGFHAGMAWMERNPEERQDPRKRLPGARSVIVVARNYCAPQPDPLHGHGRVSRYAWGRDYHKVLLKPLRKLDSFLHETVPGSASFLSIDTGPVLERAWAARAGVGWVGKNGMVIREGLGSWFFLAIIVTTAELTPDPPAVDRCGECRMCMRACPTGAIVEPGIVDSGRCISYHTIENRGEVPPELAERFGNRVFGCDACQEACPWNRETEVTSETAFHAAENRAWLGLDEIQEMNEGGFLARFAGSCIMRAKLTGLQRNARIAKSNLQRP